MSASAGLMVFISALELIPQAVSTTGVRAAIVTATAGAVLVWVAHPVAPHVHLVREKGVSNRALVRSAYLVAFGLILHDLPEGLALANAYVASPGLGVLVALAVALHNLPEQFAMAVPAVAAQSKRLLFGAAALSALAEPVGAVLGLTAATIAPTLISHFVAFAAGAMLFVSIHELVPLARRYRHGWMFALGTLTSALVYALLARLVA